MIPTSDLRRHQTQLAACTRCADMTGPPVLGQPVRSPVLLIGQAPGPREGALGRPFAWTAGKTLFKWFATIGLDETGFRQRVYMAAVCRCFPGKRPQGGDRVPSPAEVKRCSAWLDAEIGLLKPRLVIPVGKLAISQFISVTTLTEVVGKLHRGNWGTHVFDLIPLPHPSGASTWHHMAPGKTLTRTALDLIAAHEAWREVCSHN